jgi:membrane protease YdiL (CAAX protease family)
MWPTSANNYPTRNKDLYLLFVLVLIAHAGWIKFFIGEYIFLFDYVERILILAIFLVVVRPTNWQYRPRISHILVLLVATVIDTTLLIEIRDGFKELEFDRFNISAGFPLIENKFHRYFDLSAGLILVAVSEELIYRKLAHEVMARRKFRPVSIYFFSSFTFALLHLNQGLDLFLGAFAGGVLLMFIYRWSRTIYLPIAAHYLTNLWILHDAYQLSDLNKSLGAN